MANVHSIPQHHIETPNKRCQMELLTRGTREGSVVEDAIERNSWGKSRREQMCRFPITGGLHRTSGDAPFETPTLQNPVPVWCHIHKSNSSSSKRTQVAAVAYKQSLLDELVRRSTKHKRTLNASNKKRTQIYRLKDVVVGKGILTPKRFNLNYIRNNVVVCDGGATDLDAIKSRFGIHYL